MSIWISKATDLDKHKYTGLGIGPDSHGEHLLPDCTIKNYFIFAVNMNSCVHIDNGGKYILILGKGLTQGLDGTTLTSEALYPIILHNPKKKIIVLSLHYKGNKFFVC